MKTIPFYALTLTDPFWTERQQTVRDTTVWSVYDRFYETGRIPTLDCTWTEGQPNKPHHFWGSDVFKWVEGAAYIMEQHPDEKLRQAVNDIIQRVAKGIREDGYYNSCYNTLKLPIYTKRNDHELYSLGHMIEAGVAWAHATGDDRLLQLACRGADHADRIFRLEDSAGFDTPGHEEIELSLMRLYHATGNERYLALARHFIDRRGRGAKDTPIHSDDQCAQHHLPVRQQREAVGHAVRAVYLYCAMADVALETGDPGLLEAVEALFTDIYEKKMYLTGGIGSVYTEEAFSAAYHLPNQKAYAETCAALGLALFCRRMLAIRPDSRYADVAERALYNGMLSGLSLDGKAFFYTNPLEMDQAACRIPYERQHAPERAEVFSCSCCPPNLVRLIPSVGDFIYTVDGDRLYVHQYIANEGTVDGCKAAIEGCYPYDGTLRVSCPGKRLVLRRPGWCRSFTASAPHWEKDGYLYFDCDSVQITFDMTPTFVTAASAVHEDQGKVALMRGPMVYCAEAQDQPADIFRCRIDPDAPVAETAETFAGFPVLEASGHTVPQQTALYMPYQKTVPTPCKLRLIPYFTFANRGRDDMQVWLLTV